MVGTRRLVRRPIDRYVLTVAVALFALSTIITWAYYGQKAWTYLFGKSTRNERIYQALFCVFVVIGSVLTLAAEPSASDHKQGAPTCGSPEGCAR